MANNPFLDAAGAATSGLGSYKSAFDNNATTAGNQVNTLTPQTDAARQGLIAFLGRSASGDDRAAVAGSVFGNASTAYNNAKARLASNQAALGGSSGITPGANSFTAGENVALENGMAGATGGALNAADAFERARQQQNIQAIYQILTGARGEAVGERNNALQGGLGVNTTQINANQGLAQTKMQQDAQEQAKRNGLLALIAQVAQITGQSGIFGGSTGGPGGGSVGGFNPASLVPSYTPQFTPGAVDFTPTTAAY